MCNLVQNESYGHYNSKKEYQIKIEKGGWQGKYSFKCGQDQCSIDEKECKIFEHINLCLKPPRYKNYFDKYLSLGHTFKIGHKNEIKKIRNLIENIPNYLLVQYRWQTYDVCLNGIECFEFSAILRESIWKKKWIKKKNKLHLYRPL